MTVSVLDAEAVRAAVPMPVALQAVRAAFLALAAGEFELPIRTAVADGRFLTLTACHRPTGTTTVKALSLVPAREPTIAGEVLHLTSGTGPVMVLDAVAVTALRTGAVVGVATDLLAAPDAEHLVLIGLGGLAADQLTAVRAVRPLTRVTLVGRTAASVDAFRGRCGIELAGLDVGCSTDPVDAVGAADIVCCVTPATEPLFGASALPQRVHVNAVGAYRLSMRELPDELLLPGTTVVDRVEDALEESGELVHAIDSGLLRADDLIELGSLLDGSITVPPGPRTVFKSVGLAAQDWAIAQAISRALERGEVERG